MSEHTQSITLRAPDISCGHCVQAIQNRLRGVDGVQEVQASAETKLVDITFDPNLVPLQTIKDELADEGYPVAG